VELKVEGTEASVSVRDQGPGLAEEELKRVWERFYRVQRTSQSGLGLGLHICNMIIRWHGGAGWGTEHSWQGLYFLVYAAFSQIDAANLH